MDVREHVARLAGLPVIDWEPRQATPAEGVMYRIGLTPDDREQGRWTDKFASFLASPTSGHAVGLVVGDWHTLDDDRGAAPVVEALAEAAARGQLSRLRALFLGDIIEDEFPLPYIEQADVSPLFVAFPDLERLWVRGGHGLCLGTTRHARLRMLTLEGAGLHAVTIREVAQADLPTLEHLELWLGPTQLLEGGAFYDGATLDDLDPILCGRQFPALRYLGLRNSERADEMAEALARSPLLDHLAVLDLALGTLSDRGASALLASPATASLVKLDIRHHYCSPGMVEQLRALGIAVDASDAYEESANGFREVAII